MIKTIKIVGVATFMGCTSNCFVAALRIGEEDILDAGYDGGYDADKSGQDYENSCGCSSMDSVDVGGDHDLMMRACRANFTSQEIENSYDSNQDEWESSDHFETTIALMKEQKKAALEAIPNLPSHVRQALCLEDYQRGVRSLYE